MRSMLPAQFILMMILPLLKRLRQPLFWFGLFLFMKVLIEEHGWDAFEKALVKLDPDLWDMNRPAMGTKAIYLPSTIQMENRIKEER